MKRERMPGAIPDKTPDVYVTEQSAIPLSVAGVETAIPAFIGYTETATQNGKSVTNTPIRITSLAEYIAIFGGPNLVKFDMVVRSNTSDPAITAADDADASTAVPPVDITIGTTSWTFVPAAGSRAFNLYGSLVLFYKNGGAACYVVSVGDYGAAVDAGTLTVGLTAIQDESEPTMLVVPDAMALSSATEFNKVIQPMLAQCLALGDRVAILDVWGSNDLRKLNDVPKLINDFRSGVTVTDSLSYGTAYFPSLVTAVFGASDMSFANLSDASRPLLVKALGEEAAMAHPTIPADVTSNITLVGNAPPAAAADHATWDTNNATATKNLANALPVVRQLFGVMADKLNILPASGAMAGVFTFSDNTRGVWNAPANIGLSAVVAPTVKMSDYAKDDLNLPSEGTAVNAIRDVVGQGTLVCGARTLDGNSEDHRYIQVRRTLIYVEQSIMMALKPFVFAANDAPTWVSVIAMISNFLTGLWTQGGLMGTKASEAFTVQCGLGSTMTGQDVLDGYMMVLVMLQVTHPGTFIELTFTQKMEGVG